MTTQELRDRLQFLSTVTYKEYKRGCEILNRIQQQNPNWAESEEYQQIEHLVCTLGETNDYINSLLEKVEAEELTPYP